MTVASSIRSSLRAPRCAVGLALAAGLVLAGAPAQAQSTRHALVVQGASGEPQYATLHRQWLVQLVGVLRDTFKFEPDAVTVLAERPGPGEGRATSDEVRAALERLAGVMGEPDLLFVMMIGHGSGAGEEAKFNLVGPDLSAAEWKGLLAPIKGRLVVVDTTSSSFGFLTALAAPGRVVITATNSPAQRYHTIFADGFIQALTAPAADLDQNGRISVLEAFTYASRLAGQHYEQAGTMATERALLDDTGDGEGRLAGGEGVDGAVAESTYLDTVAAPTSDDPELQKLLLRQRALTDEIDALRRRRQTMTTEEYDREFERLVTELALVSSEIRRRGGG